jgi:ribonuclease HI
VETITAWVDGGCKPTNPGPMYGSFKVGGIIKHYTLGDGTNNIAEYKSVLELLHFLEEPLYNYRYEQIDILTDSQLVVGQCQGIGGKLWKVNVAHLLSLRDEVQEIMSRHKGWKFVLVGREILVRELGH